MSEQLNVFDDPPPSGRMPPEESDCGWLARLLADGRERTLSEILRVSIEQRGFGLTVHSRVNDLRHDFGFTIDHRNVPGARRGAASAYRMVR